MGLVDKWCKKSVVVVGGFAQTKAAAVVNEAVSCRGHPDVAEL